MYCNDNDHMMWYKIVVIYDQKRITRRGLVVA